MADRLAAGGGLLDDAWSANLAAPQAAWAFQSVATHPEFRRRGVCGRLVYDVAREALASGARPWSWSPSRYHAGAIYESIGSPSERSV